MDANTEYFTALADPLALFEVWMKEAVASEPSDPNAMALATVDSDGLPDVRIVLLKGLDQRGFVFYSNAESAKGEQLAATKRAVATMPATVRTGAAVQGTSRA